MRFRFTEFRSRTLIAGALTTACVGGAATFARATTVTATTATAPFTVVNYSVASGVFAIKGVVTSSSGGVGLAGYGVSQTLRELGVYGSTSGPTGIGVYGTSQYPEAAAGPTTSNETVGVYGGATNGYGVEGTTSVQNSATAGLFAGVLGIDSASNFGNNDGIFGLTNNGYFGIEGVGGSGSVGGVYGTSANGSYGVFGSSNNVGVEGASGTTPLAAANGAGTVVWSVSGTGVVTTTGTGQAIAVARGGESARTFVPTATTPVLEDVGSATLVSGTSTVRFDPAFGSSISSAVYQVFITPSGDSHGLYVTGKTATQFIVRENAGGHSTIGFDYRIVAKPFADGDRRIVLAHSAKDLGLPTRPASALNSKNRNRFPSSVTDEAVRTLLLQHLRYTNGH